MLSKEEFGTYVIQDAIVYGNPNQRNQIIDEIKNNKFGLVNLSKHKKGKFVIHKILIYLDRETLGYLLYKLNEEKHNIKKIKIKMITIITTTKTIPNISCLLLVKFKQFLTIKANKKI